MTDTSIPIPAPLPVAPSREQLEAEMYRRFQQSYMTLVEIAQYAGCNPQRISYLHRTHKFPVSLKIGQVHLWERNQELDAAMDAERTYQAIQASKNASAE